MEIEKLYQLYLKHPNISTDTRKIEEGMLFFALKGGNFNGNKFALQALEKGAAYAIIDEEAYATDKRMILVEDVLTTLQQLAHHHRTQFDIPFIAVTGSNGKTTTKELLHRVLAKKYRTHATKGNFNNHIGVPLTLLEMPLDTEMALVEMGDNHVGEVTELCKIAEPTHGFITNIGKDHIEGFGSFEANVRAKSEIFDYLIKNDGIVFVNSQDRIIANMAKRFKAPVWYGGEYDFANLELLGASPFIRYKDRQDREVQTKTIGSYNFQNMLTAFCIGKYFEVPVEEIHDAIANYAADNNRSQLIEKGTNLIILDAYNANPSSVEVAMENLEQFDTEKQKVVILGDMRELGDISQDEHHKMVEMAESKNFVLSFFVGEEFFKQKDNPGAFYKEKEELHKHLQDNPIQNALILVKGSRGIGLETVLELL
ncbi:UDP-N-acetylmuramoyl-tripeptide--D-alanyl-D-alanine ligase [Limibacter armeniacum]|uniref:UDP-N-acetylmuramoyl-tripeptide--D-alanyl-D- alanine ligase n=1 Tax=Limibacter armeniacum TaxID=466084 RepID=UPI002FE61B4E